jgi:hypothetical protein
MNINPIVAAVLRANPNADREQVERTVAAFLPDSVEDERGERILPGVGSFEGEMIRQFAPVAAPKETIEDQRAKFSGYTRAEFERLPPDARLRIHGENTAPPTPKWKEKVPTVSRTDAIQWSGLSGADYDRLPLERRQEIVDQVTFARMRGAK